jgi:hypothetical protein
MYHPIVKEQVLPGQLEELQTNPHPTERQFQSQALILKNYSPKKCAGCLSQLSDRPGYFFTDRGRKREAQQKCGIIEIANRSSGPR